MSLTGDYGKLSRWARNFGELASPGLALEVSRSMAAESVRLVEQGFEKEQDPFGNPWKPKKEPDGRKILRGKDGLLRQWRQVHASSEGFKIASKAPYSVYHQKGTGIYGSGKGRYEIKPRRAKMLRFKVGGKYVFAKSVMHPGVPIRRMEPGSRLPSLWASLYREIYFRNVRKRLGQRVRGFFK